MTDEERFHHLYLKYHRLVLQIAYKIVRNYYEAQDICQNTFVKMFRRLDLTLPDEDIKYWLLVVAANEAKDQVRKIGKYAAEAYPDDGGNGNRNEKKAADNDCFEEFLKRDLRIRILEQLRSENEEYYEIVWYVCCLQMSVGEAAGKLGLSYEQASMRLHRARTWIRVNYGEEYQDLKY